MNSNIWTHIISKAISSCKMQYNQRVWVWNVKVSPSKLAVGPVSQHQLYKAYHCASHHSPQTVLNMLLRVSAQSVPSAWTALSFRTLMGMSPVLERLPWPPVVLMTFSPLPHPLYCLSQQMALIYLGPCLPHPLGCAPLGRQDLFPSHPCSPSF